MHTKTRVVAIAMACSLLATPALAWPHSSSHAAKGTSRYYVKSRLWNPYNPHGRYEPNNAYHGYRVENPNYRTPTNTASHGLFGLFR